MEHMLVREWMSKGPVTIGSGSPIKAVIDLMRDHGVRHIPVVDGNNLVGMITDRDLKEISPSYPIFRDEEEIKYYLEEIKVSDAMTADPISVSPTGTVKEAAKILLQRKIGGLPVLEGNRLVGIITRSDILRSFVEMEI